MNLTLRQEWSMGERKHGSLNCPGAWFNLVLYSSEDLRKIPFEFRCQHLQVAMKCTLLVLNLERFPE